MVFKYLFYIDDGKIRTFCYRDGNFELVRRDGEECVNISDELFWNWWEDTVSFNKLKDEVDFCFIEVGNYHIDFNYKVTPETAWRLDDLESFCEKFMDYSNILLNIDSQKSFHVSKVRKMFFDNSEKKLNVTICSGIILKDCPEVPNIEPNEDSELRKYFQEKTKKLLADN